MYGSLRTFYSVLGGDDAITVLPRFSRQTLFLARSDGEGGRHSRASRPRCGGGEDDDGEAEAEVNKGRKGVSL